MTDTQAHARVWTLCLYALVLAAVTGPVVTLLTPLAHDPVPALHVMAATSCFIKPQIRSTGLASWAAHVGSHSTCTCGLAASQARTTLASYILTLSMAR